MRPLFNDTAKISIPIIFVLLLFIIFQSCEKDPFEANSGTFTDKRDKHEYKWVKIGEQIWMAENLAYIPYVCAPDSQCGIWVYGYEGEGSYGTNYQIYGCLYDWETAMEVCPEEWHLPSDEEWMELELFLGMDEDELFEENVGRGEEANVAGKLGAGSSLWNEVNENSTNETGFLAKPGGIRISDGRFRSIIDEANFWTSSFDNNNNRLIHRTIDAHSVLRFFLYKEQGLSVRCVKD